MRFYYAAINVVQVVVWGGEFWIAIGSKLDNMKIWGVGNSEEVVLVVITVSREAVNPINLLRSASANTVCSEGR